MKLSTAFLRERNETHRILHIDVKIFIVPEAKEKRQNKNPWHDRTNLVYCSVCAGIKLKKRAWWRGTDSGEQVPLKLVPFRS